MKRIVPVLLLILFQASNSFAQRETMTLTFTAVNNTDWIQLDSIRIMNRTQDGDTVLYYPDTVLVLDYTVGMPEPADMPGSFRILNCYPNPTADKTTINLLIPEKDKISMTVTDILGRQVLHSEQLLDQGVHSYRLSVPGEGIVFFTARWKDCISTAKVIRTNRSDRSRGALEYLGSVPLAKNLKATEAVRGFPFNQGDELLYIAHAGALQSGMPDTPQEDKYYTFQFATNIPCPGTPGVTYEGQVYNTIQIFSQCWLKENLNVGEMIDGTIEPSNNGTIEKYCYNNEPDSCTKYGGLYQWDEMMQYVAQQSAQGICPSGWHLPSDEEWKMLEGAVDSQYKFGDSTWDDLGWRGLDAGMNLKTTSGWYNNGNSTNLFGFSGLPGGYRYDYGYFGNIGDFGGYWSSSEFDDYGAWDRGLDYDYSEVYRFSYYKGYGFSVRCLRDAGYVAPIRLTFTAVNNTDHVQLFKVSVMNRTQGCETTIFYPDTVLVMQEDLPFAAGDQLLMIGYAGSLESGMPGSPEASRTFTFQFATNIPCPAAPTVTYEGQVYQTIQVFSQCWFRENLNVGTMIDGALDMTDNEILEKYCYYNMPENCAYYGGLYQWPELMQYADKQGVQGVCPPGWHVPTDEDWKVLEGGVDSHYGIGNTEWDIYEEERGFDAGTNLKTTSGWYEDGNGTDLYGFSAIPTGFRDGVWGDFSLSDRYADWWTSTRNTNDENWVLHIAHNWSGTGRFDYSDQWGFHVRCLKDE